MATSIRNLPRREASRRGSEAISKQLESSPVSSGDDHPNVKTSAPSNSSSSYSAVMSKLTASQGQPEFRVPSLPPLSPVRRPPVTRTYSHRSRSHSNSGTRTSISPQKSLSASTSKARTLATPESPLSPLPSEIDHRPRNSPHMCQTHPGP